MMDGSLVAHGARRANYSDVLHMIRVARPAYAQWPVDWGAVAVWLNEIVREPDVFAAVCGHAAIIARSHCWEGLPSLKNVTVIFVAGLDHVWDAVRCLRLTAAWGQAIGADTLKVDAETGVDLGPLVRRIGLPMKRVPAYSVRLLHGA